MVKLLGHRQTKETATDKLHLLLPRHIPTLPNALIEETRLNGRYRGEADRRVHRGYDREGSFAHCRIFESGRSTAILLTSLVKIRQ